MLSDVEAAVREISAGLTELQAEGRQTEAQLQRWSELARRAKELVQPTVADSTNCLSCGNTLKSSAKFCTKCGTTRQGAPASVAAPLTCSVCGGALRPDVRFCRACGAPAQSAQQPAPAPPPPLPPPPLPLAAEPVWRPTHVVPPAGMAAWTTPDAAAQPVAQLGARTELELVSQRGAWAEVRASNGWAGWVDGRLLVSR